MPTMIAPGEWRCARATLTPGASRTLRLGPGDAPGDGFVVHHQGAYHAYVNRCPHAGTPLDLWPNEFFSEDGRWLVCATHGAVFDPATGRCVSGPCAGASLTPLRVRCEDEHLVVSRGER